MHRLFLCFLVALALLPSAQPVSAQSIFLRAQGATLYYGAQPVRLVGTNLDNIGSASAGIGTGRVADSPYTLPDYQLIRASGANHVRLGLWYGWYTRDKSAFYRYVDTQLSYARTAGLWLVPLLFSTPGDCYEGYGNSCGFWGNAAEKQALAAFWREFAARYATDPVIAGYDILNEPTPPNDCKQWFPVAGNVIAAIREVSQQLVFVETCSDPGNDLQWNGPPRGPNVVWSVHDYSPMGLSHNFNGATYPGYANEWYGRCYFEAATFTGGNSCPQADIRESHGISYAASQGVPLYIGEWGATSKLQNDEQYTRDKGALYRQFGVSHAHYTWWHQTITTGGYYQWGLSSSTGTIDDQPKLDAVKASWTGEYQPTFGTTPPQPPAELTATVPPSATPLPATVATTATVAPPTAIATRTPNRTAQARQTATAAARTATAPATASPAATAVPVQPTATLAPVSADALSFSVANGHITVTGSAEGLVSVATWPAMPVDASLPSFCARQLGNVVCWAGLPGSLQLPAPEGVRWVVVTQGGALRTWVAP